MKARKQTLKKVTNRPAHKKASVIWAIDPFEAEARPYPAAVKELLAWIRKAEMPLLPVHVLSIPQIEYGPENEDTWVSRYVPSVDRAIKQYLQEVGAEGLAPPRILLNRLLSRKKAVQALLELADQVDSPMIVVSSRGRSGLQRMVLGSFAESLLSESTRPLLILNHTHPDTQSGSRFERVLFPTDFSDLSRQAFRRFLPQARFLGAELILFHSVTVPTLVLSGSGAMGVPTLIPDDFLARQGEWADKEGASWVEEAKNTGIAAHAIVEEGGLSSQIASTVLHVAREVGARLIAMASTSGPISSLVAGSVARDLLRSNTHSLWVCGPKTLQGTISMSMGQNGSNSRRSNLSSTA